MEKDPFYLFNNAVGQITPDCCQFLEDLAKCISPDVGRTREKREKQLGTGVSTRLLFVPDDKRDIRKPLDVTKEAMVAHHGRFFSLPQFAVLTTEILKAKGEPSPLLHGWAGSILPIDQRAQLRIVSLTWWLLPKDSGRNSSTTSRVSSTVSNILPPPVMSLISRWQGVPSILKAEKDFGGTSTPRAQRERPWQGKASETHFSAGCRVLELWTIWTQIL